MCTTNILGTWTNILNTHTNTQTVPESRERVREKKMFLARNIEWLQKMCNIVKRLSQVTVSLLSVFVCACGMYILWIISKFIAFQHVSLSSSFAVCVQQTQHGNRRTMYEKWKKNTRIWTKCNASYVCCWLLLKGGRTNQVMHESWRIFRSSYNARYFYSHWTHFVNHNCTNRSWFVSWKANSHVHSSNRSVGTFWSQVAIEK